jgi:hypothetical protein
VPAGDHAHTWQSAVPLVLEVLEPLDYGHRPGVLHRGIKAETIVMVRIASLRRFSVRFFAGASGLAVLARLKLSTARFILVRPYQNLSE